MGGLGHLCPRCGMRGGHANSCRDGFQALEKERDHLKGKLDRILNKAACALLGKEDDIEQACSRAKDEAICLCLKWMDNVRYRADYTGQPYIEAYEKARAKGLAALAGEEAVVK